MSDPFQVLGLKRDAIKSELKERYHALAVKHHPDKNPGDPTAEERFKAIQQAYETLLVTIPETKTQVVSSVQVDKPISRKEPEIQCPPQKPKDPLQNIFTEMEGSIYRDIFGGDV